MRFICVSDRELKDSYCALCTEKISGPYIREIDTRLAYCHITHYNGHVNVAILALEHHAREVN